LLAAVRHRYAVMIVFELGASDADAPEFDAVARQLAASQLVELHRRDPVAGEITVKRPRAAIARLADVADQHWAAASPEHQCGTQSGRATSHDDHVVHAGHFCKTISTS